MKLTVMTYNICSGRNLERDMNMEHSASVINRIQPDFITVNEVCKNTSYAPQHQADELGRLTGYYPVFGRSIDIAGGQYGNAFLTRCPLIEHEVIDIPDRFEEGAKYVEHRTVLRCVVEAAGGRLTVLSTHFGLSEAEQKSAVETVMAVLEKEENPVILMGDLNLTPDSGILRPLFACLTDTAGESGEIKTFPSDKPDIKIDYIMHRGPVKTISVRSMDTQCSDHRPLIAELEIN